MNRVSSRTAFAAGAVLWMAAAQGAVVATGDAIFIDAPASVKTGGLTSDTNFYVFEESTLTLGSDLSVDWLASDGGTLDSGNGGLITAGTRVTSYFVHFEPATQASEVSGTLTFPQKILAVIFTAGNLADSDPVLGASGTEYPTGQTGRKYESWDQEHSYLVSNTDDSLFIHTKTWFNPSQHLMDQARVITAPVPVPAALWLFGSGVLAVLGFSRRKRREAALAG